MKLEDVELQPLLKEELERECPNHEVECRVEEGNRVQADRRLISRAVVNVVRNAHRRGSENSAIHIDAKKLGDEVEVMISDNGSGAGLGVVTRLFEPFYRSDSARNREVGGNGLGMAIVYSAFEACVESVVAKHVDPHELAVPMRLKASKN